MDFKNEMLKRGDDPMVDLIYPAVRAFWREERVLDQWNIGMITNVWKGKGDREKMENQRGITVSITVGTIPEEIINNRMTEVIEFTQAQAGGRKGACTADHIFIIRGIISLAKKLKRNIIITFYDVKKAYDRADVPDMMYIASQNGFQGKIWRLAKILNEDLSARVKTGHGLTRTLKQEKGGKQGGKLIVPLFAKMMDVLSEDMEKDESLGIKIDILEIPSLLYMDDVASIAEGYLQQQKTLDAVNEFGVKHQL